jgi:hypothetical protein
MLARLHALLDHRFLSRVGNLQTLVGVVGIAAAVLIAIAVALAKVFTSVGWVPLFFLGLALLLAVLLVLSRRQQRPVQVASAPYSVVGAAKAHAEKAEPRKRIHYDMAAEQAREREVIRALHAEYLSTRDDLSPHMIAGLMPLPGEWVVKRLEDMGETFRWSEYRP